LINLLRPTRPRNRAANILIRQDPRHRQRRDIRIETLCNVHQFSDFILGLIPCIGPHGLHDGLYVGIVRDAQAGIVGDAVNVFACEEAALERGKDCQAKATAGVERCVFEFFVDFFAREEGVAGLFDDFLLY
jgi:hypothetical protein